MVVARLSQTYALHEKRACGVTKTDEETGSPTVERVFAALQKLITRIDSNSWLDRVVGKFSTNSDKFDDEPETKNEDLLN
jgi:hypothetical protein